MPQEGRPDNYHRRDRPFPIGRRVGAAPIEGGRSDDLHPHADAAPARWPTVKAPDLNKVPAVAARFKVYEATQKTEGDSLHFVYSLRPLAEGDEPFPAVALAYFDVDQDRYVTVHSEPIPITITKAERLSGDQIVAVAARGRAERPRSSRPAAKASLPTSPT